MSVKRPLDRIVRRIKNSLIRERLLLFIGGLLGTVASILSVWILMSVLATIFVLTVAVKITIMSLSGILIIYFFWRLAFSKLFSGNQKQTALKIEKKYPILKGRLIAALQFSKEKYFSGFSGDLVQATMNQAVERSKGLDFNKVISAYPIWRYMKILGGAATLTIFLLLLFPGLFSNSYVVYSRPTEMIMPPLGYQLTSNPVSSMAIKYRDLDLGGILTGDQFPDEAVVYYKYAGGIWQKAKIELKRWNRYPATFGDSLSFFTTLKQVRRSVDYYVKAGKLKTPTEHIDVVDRPRVTGIKMSLFYPKYTGLQPAVIDENDGNISAVIGSRVTMQIQTNVPSQTAEMLFDDSTRSAFKINGLSAEQSFRIEEDRYYYIALTDFQSEKNPDPIEYQITAVPDEFPMIEVLRPGIDLNLNDDMMIPLLVHISDDYGFSSLVLKYQVVRIDGAGEENVAVLHFSDKIKTEGEVNFNWDVEPLALRPSEYVKYHFEIADNDRISGPKISSSRQYIARLPSLDEIIAETEAEYGRNIDRAEQYLQQHKELSERLKNIARKIDQERGKSDQKLNWQHQKELEEITDKDEKLSEQIKETAREMDKMIDQMQENRLTSRELLEKLAEIQKLFEEVATPEMKEARLKLMQAMKNMNRKEIEQALKDYQMNQEDMMKRLDRTITLLKKLKIEQKVNAMTEKAKELAQKQDQVNQDTEASKDKELPDLAPKEKSLKNDLEQLKKDAEELQKMVEETPFLKTEEANQFAEAVKQCSAGKNMQKMSEQLDQQQKEPALDEGKKSYSKLLQLSDQMQQQQSKICQGGGGEAARLMRDAIEDINYVSNDQERLIDEVQMIRGQSEALRDLAIEQVSLKEMMRSLSGRIEAIGKESPFIAAELGNLMRTTDNYMNLSVDRLEERRGIESVNFQREALFNLNRAALRMLDALEKQKNCNKGGSCDKPSQKMQSLCDKQSQLNQQTQGMCNKPGGMKPSPGAMKRLAAEQGAIGKSMRELQDEFGSSREVLGRLDAIADEMEKVAEQISEGQVGEETLERQLKIHSRMLDATRTMQRKDFVDQRKAASGEDIMRSSPAALSGNQLQGGLDIEDRLKKFMNESYPPEYEEYIKAYFKALMQQYESQDGIQ